MISRNVFDSQNFTHEVRYMIAMRDPCYTDPGYVYVHVIKTSLVSELDALVKELNETHGLLGYASAYGNIPMFEFKERLTNGTT